MTLVFKPDRLHLNSNSEWLSGPPDGGPGSLTPITHLRTCEMLSKSIVLPSNSNDVPHLIISGQRFEYSYEDAPDFVDQIDFDLERKTATLHLLGNKKVEFHALNKQGKIKLPLTIIKEAPYWDHQGLHLKLSRKAWHLLTHHQQIEVSADGVYWSLPLLTANRS